jgi:hypothetical protein
MISLFNEATCYSHIAQLDFYVPLRVFECFALAFLCFWESMRVSTRQDTVRH